MGLVWGARNRRWRIVINGRHFSRDLVNAKQTALDGISRQAALPSWAVLNWPFCGSGFAPHSHIGGILKLI